MANNNEITENLDNFWDELSFIDHMSYPLDNNFTPSTPENTGDEETTTAEFMNLKLSKQATRVVDVHQNAEKAEHQTADLLFAENVFNLDKQQTASPNPRDRKRGKSLSVVPTFRKDDTFEETEAEGRVPGFSAKDHSIDPSLLDQLDPPIDNATNFNEAKPFIFPYSSTTTAAANAYYASLSPNTTDIYRHDHLGQQGIAAKAPMPGSLSNQYALPQGVDMRRRKSVPTKSNLPGYVPTVFGQVATRGHSTEKPELDAAFIQAQIISLGYPEAKKEPLPFLQASMNLVCGYSNVFVGGFYLTNNNNKDSAAWLLACPYPSKPEFMNYFHYNVGERFIMQAAAEKRCFCVHSSSWENNSSLLSFLFVPIPNEKNPNANAIAVMVLGTILKGEVDLHAHLLFLDQVRKPIASILNSLIMYQFNLSMLQKVNPRTLASDTSTQQPNIYKRVEAAVIRTIKTDSEEYVVLATNHNGLIMYASPSTVKITGYQPFEVVGKISLVQFHDLPDLSQRAHELEQEFKETFAADFQVIIKKTLASRGLDDTRTWHWIRKDRSAIVVQMTVRPLQDENGTVLGYLAVAKPLEVPGSNVGTGGPHHTQQASSSPLSRSPPTKTVSSPQQSQQEEVKSE